jgi:T5SS/PEP-CTERM-associated repeat protein
MALISRILNRVDANLSTLRAGLCSVLFAAGLVSRTASGQTIETYWVAPGVGNWMISSNWSDGRPNALLGAILNNGGTAQLFDLASVNDVLIGFSASSSGAIEIAGGTLNAQQLYLGQSGSGAISIHGGGRLRNTVNLLGYLVGSHGEVTVDGASSGWDSNRVEVGYLGSGSLSIGHGGQVVTAESFIAQGAASQSTAIVDGAGSTWQTSGNLAVAVRGVGALSIKNGALVENSDGQIGQLPGSSGDVTVTGGGSRWKTNSVIAVGVEGTGKLTIADSALVTSVNGRIGRESHSTGAVTIDGAGSQWNCTGVVTVGQATGMASSTALLTLLNGGSISALGGLTVHGGGKLQGDGVVNANVSNNWQVAPHGVLQVAGNYSEHSILGQLEIELASSESVSRLAVSGNAAIAGVLRVKLLDGYVPQAGASFDVLDWGTRTGTFSSLSLPALPAPLAWNTSQLYTTGVLSVTAPFLAADFDENGTVNAADLTKWKAGFGTAVGAMHMQGDANVDGRVDGSDFLIWQRQLGGVAVEDATIGVPEPSALSLLNLGAIAASTAALVGRGPRNVS